MTGDLQVFSEFGGQSFHVGFDEHRVWIHGQFNDVKFSQNVFRPTQGRLGKESVVGVRLENDDRRRAARRAVFRSRGVIQGLKGLMEAIRSPQSTPDPGGHSGLDGFNGHARFFPQILRFSASGK